MHSRYSTPKQALDALLEQNSAFATAEILDIHRANISHYIHRYKMRVVPSVITQALISKGYFVPIVPKRRIRSQITWESDKQKEYFLKYVREQGFSSITDYCRDKANSRAAWEPVYKGWRELWK